MDGCQLHTTHADGTLTEVDIQHAAHETVGHIKVNAQDEVLTVAHENFIFCVSAKADANKNSRKRRFNLSVLFVLSCGPKACFICKCSGFTSGQGEELHRDLIGSPHHTHNKRVTRSKGADWRWQMRGGQGMAIQNRTRQDN